MKTMKKIKITFLITYLLIVTSVSLAQNKVSELDNLALAEDSFIMGSVKDGRGVPLDIIYNPKTKDFATNSKYHEYGVKYKENLGLVNDSNSFWWSVGWKNPKLVNYITFCGTYDNQPQPNASWVIQYNIKGKIIDLDKGTGGWIDSGLYEWKSKDLNPILMDAVIVKIFSDGENDLKSIHLRGNADEKVKATLIQLLPYKIVEPLPEIDDSIKKLNDAIDLFKSELLIIKIETLLNKKKIETLKNRLKFKE